MHPLTRILKVSNEETDERENRLFQLSFYARITFPLENHPIWTQTGNTDNAAFFCLNEKCEDLG